MPVESALPESDPSWASALASGDPERLLAWAEEALRSGRVPEARQALEAAFDRHPGDLPLARALLEHHLRYRAWRRMEAVLRRALAAHPDAPDLLLLDARRLEGMEEWAGAARAYQRALRRSPADPEPLLRLARVLRVDGRAEEALRTLEAALEAFDDTAAVHAAVGYAAIDAGRPGRAVAAFERALALNPEWPTYLDDLAGALMLCERWPEAARLAVRSLERRKRNERAWTVYAIAHQRMGDDARAEQGYRNALRAAREPARAKGNFGLFLARRPERVLEAARLLREALEAHPDWAEVARRLKDLRDPSA